ncbi:hypothetical protein BD779DRAFT_1609010 [Infundibulicybe gibba]|nr:hypothetical protein BD779DRAFT_1609010 [Infundibulicybe gibba]
MEPPHSNRKYTHEEKQQLLANLDIEVAHRTRQFESWLNDRLENFSMYQEGQVSRIPKQIRSMSMREFGGKYQANVQMALRGFQKERLMAAGGEAALGEIDKSTRKRKWIASQESEGEVSADGNPLKAAKNARTTVVASPKKKAGSSTGPGTAQRAHLLAANKTPNVSRSLSRIPASPSPQKGRPPFNGSTSSYISRPLGRPTSPLKHPSVRPSGLPQTQRVPSSSTFNPLLPPKTPAYPRPPTQDGMPHTRLPRRDESMLSVNGSPLANPYELGMVWFSGVDDEGGDDDNSDGANMFNGGGSRTLKRTKSNIRIRRDPSATYQSTSNPKAINGFHSRTNSQASLYPPSSQSSSSTESRENSQFATAPSTPPSRSQLLPESRINYLDATHQPFHSDGHLLEFDPLQTSPGTLDALEGITDSAKKQARLEMSRLVQAAVDKWKIG